MLSAFSNEFNKNDKSCQIIIEAAGNATLKKREKKGKFLKSFIVKFKGYVISTSEKYFLYKPIKTGLNWKSYISEDEDFSYYTTFPFRDCFFNRYVSLIIFVSFHLKKNIYFGIDFW